MADNPFEQAAPELKDAELIEQLEARGFVVVKSEHSEPRVRFPDARETGKVRFGVASDTHLGHVKQQLSYLHDFCREAEAFGVEFMLHGGDVVDGQNMHRDQQFELHRHGVNAQANYAIEHLPIVKVRRKTVPWWAIGGNHDGSGYNDVGANVLRHVSEARKDFNFIGAPLATFYHGPLAIRILHPDGGVPYARSYRLQKAVEQLAPDDKPHIYLFGHWHVTNHLPAYRNVEAISLPCFQAQTSYMARKALAPVIGGLLCEATYDDSGLAKLTTHWVTYRSPMPKDY